MKNLKLPEIGSKSLLENYSWRHIQLPQGKQNIVDVGGQGCLYRCVVYFLTGSSDDFDLLKSTFFEITASQFFINHNKAWIQNYFREKIFYLEWISKMQESRVWADEYVIYLLSQIFDL